MLEIIKNTMRKKYIYFILLLAFSVNAQAQYTVGVSYFGVNNYIEYIPGDMPVIFVAPHAGNLQPTTLPDIATRGNDNGTMDLVLFMADSMHFKTGGCRPHIIINHLRPSKLNPVYSISDSTTAAGTNPTSLQALNDFHNFIQIAHDRVSSDWGKGHYFELHGNGTSEQWNMVGLGISKTSLNLPDATIATMTANSTIKNLCTAGGADFLEVLKGPTSLGGMLDSMGWKSTTSPAHPAPPDSVTFFYAGQNTWRYGSKYTGTIDATHLESYWRFMVLNSNKSKYSNDLADTVLRFMNIHYGLNYNCAPTNLSDLNNSKITTKIFPNPAFYNEIINIESKGKINEILVYNLNGELCKKINSSLKIEPHSLHKGIYLVRIEMKSGIIEHQKLLIQ